MNTNELLKTHNLKITPARTAVLTELSKSKHPLSLGELEELLKNSTADLATLYRTINTFVEAELVRPITFQDGKSRYELLTSAHHHHLICKSCGTVVDISKCNISRLESEVLAISGFSSLTNHSLEFFGICKSCI